MGDKHCRATGDWTIAVPTEFAMELDDDSWMAYEGDRCVYVASVAVRADGRDPLARSLYESASKKLAPATAEIERFSHDEAGLVGGAQIRRDGDRFELKGLMCADGSVATCAIWFVRAEHRDWALATWRSLRHSS